MLDILPQAAAGFGFHGKWFLHPDFFQTLKRSRTIRHSPGWIRTIKLITIMIAPPRLMMITRVIRLERRPD